MVTVIHDLADTLVTDVVECGELAQGHAARVRGADDGVSVAEITPGGRRGQPVGLGTKHDSVFGFDKARYRGALKARMEHSE